MRDIREKLPGMNTPNVRTKRFNIHEIPLFRQFGTRNFDAAVKPARVSIGGTIVRAVAPPRVMSVPTVTDMLDQMSLRSSAQGGSYMGGGVSDASSSGRVDTITALQGGDVTEMD